MNKQKKHIKKIIQTGSVQQPSDDFSKNIMSKVNALAAEETLQDPVLSTMLKNAGSEQVQNDFTQNVLSQIQSKQSAYKPLISKPAWVAILIFISAFIIWVLQSTPAENINENIISSYLTALTRSITTFDVPFLENPQTATIFMISIFCLGSLTFFDFMLRSKNLHR